VRLIVARCSVRYSGRLSTTLPEGVRLLMIKADGTFMVWADGGGQSVKPLNWMTPPTVIEEVAADGIEAAADGTEAPAGSTEAPADGTEAPAGSTEAPAPGSERVLVVRKRAGSSEDRLEILISEVLSDSEHEMGSPDDEAGLAKDGVEAHLQQLLAERPEWCGEGLRLVRREWPTDIGPVDLMCRDGDERWVAVEVKRIAGIDAVEQLARYLERIRRDPAFDSCRGVLAAQLVKPQARVLARARGIECIEVDLSVLRGEREPELRLFAA
jgi:RecB family endonuclease NucS